MRVLLVCFGGWSTSILAKKVEKALSSRGASTVEVAPVELGMSKLGTYDVALVAPQVRHMVTTLRQAAAKTGTPVLEISMQEYAAADPSALVARICQAVEQKG